MTEQEFIVKATDLVKQIVDGIAEKEYAKLASFSKIESSWIEPGETQEDGFRTFGEWLDEQLAIWEEDEEWEFVVDHFEEKCLEEIELVDNKSFVTYKPTNSGERLDLWFEIVFEVGKDEQITATLNVNI